MIRPSWSNPQSSSSQRLNAEVDAIVAPTSSRSASSTPHPSVGNSSAEPRPCSSITARRASRPWYSGCSDSGSTCISVRGSTPSGIWPRNSGSRQPGTMIGSNVGFGTNPFTFPPIRSFTRLPSCTGRTPRSLNFGSRWRVKASSVS